MIDILWDSFYHHGVNYDFAWCRGNHIFFQQMNLNCSRALWRYLNKIHQKKFPVELFLDESMPRISTFKIKKLKRGIVPAIGQELITKGLIKEFSLKNKDKTQESHEFMEFLKNMPNYKKYVEKNPGHDKILNYIIRNDRYAIAKEVPVWYDTPEKITGHIDLIRIKNNQLYVLDYKPEGRFMHSLPQVAYYGLVLKKQLNLDKVICSTFNLISIWEYDPLETLTETTKVLKNLNAPPFDWEYFFLLLEQEKKE
ncbi:MAG: hypothetical protein ACTSU2_10030 [Promethearchaeota archaeon]